MSVDKNTKNKLVALVEEIRTTAGCRHDLDSLLGRLEKETGYPDVGMLIFCPADGKERSAEEIVDWALANSG